MTDPGVQLPPLMPSSMRVRVAVPIAPPVLKPPSLIPHDVLQEVEREARKQELADAVEEGLEPRTTPQPMPADELMVVRHGAADPELAMHSLSQVKLFAELPAGSLEALAASATQIEIPDGETLFEEGTDANSFYVVVDGTLELVREKEGREVAMHHAGAGEAVGIFGLFSAQVRAASARAIGDCVVVEVPGAALQAVVEADDGLHDRLLRFYRERLLEGFMANRLFADIDSIARARLLGRFTHKSFKPNEPLVSPGEVTNLIVVVTHGTLILEDKSQSRDVRHFEVSQGQFLAVTSALSGLPSRLRVFSPGFCTVSMLSQRDLNELFRDYPALRALPSRMNGAARALDRDVFCGTTGLPGL